MIEYPNDPGAPVPPATSSPTGVPAVPPPAPLVAQPAGGPPVTESMYRDSIGYGLWFLFLFGLGGVHRIYLGKYGTGILWLLTWGLFGVGQFIDLFRMRSLVTDANVREGYLPHPRLAQRLAAPAPPAPLAPRQTVQQSLLKAAQRNGGALTVTQGVVATGLTFEQVEEALREMVAKGYVDVDNAPDSGVVVYRFPELAGPFN